MRSAVDVDRIADALESLAEEVRGFQILSNRTWTTPYFASRKEDAGSRTWSRPYFASRKEGA